MVEEMEKNFDELTFSDDFMFCKVLSNNPDLCKEMVEMITGRKVSGLPHCTTDTQKYGSLLNTST